MSNQSNTIGRAYEYVCIETLNLEINKVRESKIERNSSYDVAEECWNIIDLEMQGILKQSALTAVYSIFDLEPRILENDDDILILKLQKDSEGEIGDDSVGSHSVFPTLTDKLIHIQHAHQRQ